MSNQQATNTCPNCGTMISCSCQIKQASDGKRVCSNCASNYEMQLTILKNKIVDINNANDQPSQ